VLLLENAPSCGEKTTYCAFNPLIRPWFHLLSKSDHGVDFGGKLKVIADKLTQSIFFFHFFSQPILFFPFFLEVTGIHGYG